MAVEEANRGRETHRNKRNEKRKKGKRERGKKRDEARDNLNEVDIPLDTDADNIEESSSATEEAPKCST